MKRKLAASFAFAVGLLMVCSPTLAHHGTSVSYDMKRTITLKGTVTEFVWANPHCQLYFDVKDDKGNVAHWGGEFMSPNRMAKAGWSKNILKPGDQITITLFPSKLGKNFGNVANIILPNGQTRVAISPEDAAQRSEIGKDAEPK